MSDFPNPRNYASWGRRVIGYLIDYIPVALLGVIAIALFNASTNSFACVGSVNDIGDVSQLTDQLTCETYPGFAAGVPLGALAIVAGLAYWLWNRVFRMGRTGSSIGMGVAGTKAVKEATGEPLGAGLNFLRQILLSLDYAVSYIGVLWPLWDSKRQCLISDKATGAVVLPTT